MLVYCAYVRKSFMIKTVKTEGKALSNLTA